MAALTNFANLIPANSSESEDERGQGDYRMVALQKNEESLENTEVSPAISPLLPLKTLAEMGHEVKEFEQEEVSQFKTDLYEHLVEMTRNNVRPDLVIKIGSITYRCYAIVLQSFSNLIFDMDDPTSIVLPPSKVTPRSFEILYHWMKTDQKVSVRINDLIELLDAATFLGVDRFREQSLEFIHDEKVMTEDKIFLTYVEAKERKFEFSRQLLETRIKKFFLTLVSYRDFVDLDVLSVCVLLNSSNIGVNSELEAFMAGIRWLNYDWENRKDHSLKIMECIRFNLLAPWLLTSLQYPDAVEEVKRVISYGNVRQLINVAIAFTSTSLFYANDPAAIQKYIRDNELPGPVSRFWIYDSDCSHHHKQSCQNMTEQFSYPDFKRELKRLRNKHNYYWQTLKSAEPSDPCRCGNNGDGIPDIFKRSLPFLFNFTKMQRQARCQDQASSSLQSSSASGDTTQFSELDDNTCTQNITSSPSHSDETNGSRILAGNDVAQISPFSGQGDTTTSSIQEVSDPSSSQEKQVTLIYKNDSYANRVKSEASMQMVCYEEPKNMAELNRPKDDAVLLYQKTRVVKLTSSESYSSNPQEHQQQQQELKITEEVELISEIGTDEFISQMGTDEFINEMGTDDLISETETDQ